MDLGNITWPHEFIADAELYVWELVMGQSHYRLGPVKMSYDLRSEVGFANS